MPMTTNPREDTPRSPAPNQRGIPVRVSASLCLRARRPGVLAACVGDKAAQIARPIRQARAGCGHRMFRSIAGKFKFWKANGAASKHVRKVRCDSKRTCDTRTGKLHKTGVSCGPHHPAHRALYNSNAIWPEHSCCMVTPATTNFSGARQPLQWQQFTGGGEARQRLSRPAAPQPVVRLPGPHSLTASQQVVVQHGVSGWRKMCNGQLDSLQRLDPFHEHAVAA